MEHMTRRRFLGRLATLSAAGASTVLSTGACAPATGIAGRSSAPVADTTPNPGVHPGPNLVVGRGTRPTDLVRRVVQALGAEFQDVVISELKEHTYFARLRVRRDGELIEVDARPSDAIAVAVTCDPPLPIYVSEEVLEDVLGE